MKENKFDQSALKQELNSLTEIIFYLSELLPKMITYSRPLPINEDKEWILETFSRGMYRAFGETIWKLLGKYRAWIKDSDMLNIAERIICTGNLKAICCLLEKFPDLSEELRRKGMEKIISSSSHSSQWWLFHLLENIPDLPEDLFQRAVERNHKSFRVRSEIIDALNSFLSIWLVNREYGTRYMRRYLVWIRNDEIPVFINPPRYSYYPSRYSYLGWDLVQKTDRGALLRLSEGRSGDKVSLTKVILLPDVTGKGRGHAAEVSRSVRSVHGAISWMYHQDPKKFKGFDREV